MSFLPLTLYTDDEDVGRLSSSLDLFSGYNKDAKPAAAVINQL